jgi:hypothetical protein
MTSCDWCSAPIPLQPELEEAFKELKLERSDVQLLCKECIDSASDIYKPAIESNIP